MGRKLHRACVWAVFWLSMALIGALMLPMGLLGLLARGVWRLADRLLARLEN